MTYGAKHIADSFRTVRTNTIRVAEDIPEGQYSFRAASEIRSVGEMLAHMAFSTRWALAVHRDERRSSFDGLDFPTLFQQALAQEREPRTKQQVIDTLRREGDEFANWVEGLSDDFVAEHFTMPPGATPATKTRFEMLLSAKEHEMHHRGQLMLIERLLGIVPHLTREMQARMQQRAAEPVTT